MDVKARMTKQAVRDLNHLGPKKRPAAVAPEGPPVDEAKLVVPPVIAEVAVPSPIEPTPA